jgi:tetratricopeptide (TPR) repeat protein
MKFQYTLLICILFLMVIPLSADREVGFADEGNAAAIREYNEAVDFAAAGEMDKALTSVNNALDNQPNFTLALVTKGNILINLGRLDEAEKAINVAAGIEPEDPMVLVSQSSLMQSRGDHAAAIRYANIAITSDPGCIEAWILKGTSHGSLGEYESAKNASLQALSLDPGNNPAQANLAYALRMMEANKTGMTGRTGAQSPLPWILVPLSVLALAVLRRV